MLNQINIKNILFRGVYYIIPLFFLLFSFGSDFLRFFLSLLFIPLFVFLLIYFKKYFSSENFYFYTYEKIFVLFLFLIFASSILSNNSYYSFFGDYGNGIFSFISIFIFGILFLIISRVKDIFTDNYKILKIFLYSSIGFFVYKIIASFFPVINVFKPTTEDLIILATINILIFFPLLLSDYFNSKDKKGVKLFLFILFFLLSIVFYKPLFFLFLLAFFLQLLLMRRNVFKSLSKKYIFLIILIFSFGALLSAGPNNTYKIHENNLDRTTSLKIAYSALKTDFLFGVGLGSYSEYFSQYRPASFNYNDNWQIRFKNSHSLVCNLPVTAGSLATFTFVFFLIFLIFVLYKTTKKYDQNKDDYFYVSFFGVSLFLLVLPFLMTFTYFSFILFFGGLALFLNFSRTNLYYKNNGLLIKNKYNIFQILFYLFLIIWILLISFSVKFLLADSYYKKNTLESVLKAQEYNSSLKEYDISLSKIYLQNAKNELRKTNKDYGLVAKNIDDAKKYAEMAIGITPHSVVSYETLGIIYRDIANYSSNGEVYAINALEKAFTLEPSNPVLATEIAKLYLLQKDNEKAMYYFNKAYALKNDYGEANLGLARVMIENGNNKQAIELLNEIKTDDFDNSKIYFELGRAYFNMNNNNLAIDNFQKSLLYEPNNSNALYSLAVTYERIGDAESAFLYYKKTQELNPGNVELLKKINTFK